MSNKTGNSKDFSDGDINARNQRYLQLFQGGTTTEASAREAVSFQSNSLMMLQQQQLQQAQQMSGLGQFTSDPSQALKEHNQDPSHIFKAHSPPTQSSPPHTESFLPYFHVMYHPAQSTTTRAATIVIQDSHLVHTLKQLGLNSEGFYDAQPKIESNELIRHLPILKQNSNHSQALSALSQFLEKEYQSLYQKIEKMIHDSQISFDALWYLFQSGKKFFTVEEGEPVGCQSISCRYHKLPFSRQFSIIGQSIVSNGKSFLIVQKTYLIQEFKGLTRIDDLPCRPITQSIMNYLTSRGEKYCYVALGAHYLNYQGTITWKHFVHKSQFKADGRVMVDEVSFKRMNPEYVNTSNPLSANHHLSFSQGDKEDSGGLKNIPREKLFLCWPFIKGFSFACKKWGEIAISGLEQIRFDDQAFDRLVLPHDKKQLIRALVEHNQYAFSDIIEEKGKGTIFLLMGSSGVGKTLTAELISETLKLPLYSISMGELGATASELETNLRRILETTAAWKGILLIDEADVFLERRSTNDIFRNALVSVFLRLLEYHQGILFLTSNRVHCIDDAFHSRISVALLYPELDQKARNQVWTNLFEAAKISTARIDLEKLSSYPLNGRQIKNIIRLAQCLALSQHQDVSNEHFDCCVKLVTDNGVRMSESIHT